MGERLALRRLRATSLIRASASAVPAAGPRGLLAPGTAPAIPAAPKLAPPPVQDAGLDDSLEMAVGTPPRRRRHGAGEQRAAPTLASPWNARRERRRLEKEVEADEDAAAARKARRRKSAMALAPKLAVVVADKAAVAEKGEDTSLALVPAPPDATHSKHISIRSIRL
jgi:hypothetical protein